MPAHPSKPAQMGTESASLVRRVFDQASELPRDEQRSFVAHTLGDRTDLIDELMRLLGAPNGQPLEPLIAFTDDLFSSGDASDQDVVAALEVGNTPMTPLGSATVQRALGLRSTSQVFLVELESPTRPAALKLLIGSRLDREAMRRFRAEAKMLAMLSHPGIVTLLAAGPTTLPDGEQVPSLLTTYIDGRELADWTAQTDPSPRTCARLIAQVARAMHHAHLHGVIHRDLKPSNILVDHDENPHVLDLGVARFLDGPALPSGQTLATLNRALVGTPAYMAPEQLTAHSQNIDLQCDVHALGVILYELLTGQRPVQTEGLGIDDIRRRKVHDTPAKPALSGKDVQIADAVMLAIHPNRDIRYRSCEAFGDDLQRALDGVPLVHRPPGKIQRLVLWARRERLLAGALVLVLVTLVAGITATLWQARQASIDKDRAVVMFETTQGFARWVVFDLDKELSLLTGSAPLRRELIANAARTLDELRIDSLAEPELVLSIAEARLRLADVLFWELGDWDSAHEQVIQTQRVLDLYPDHAEPVAKLMQVRAWAHSAFDPKSVSTRESVLQFELNQSLAVEPEYVSLVDELPHDHRLWVWLAENRVYLSRNTWALHRDSEGMFHWIGLANEAADRAYSIAPQNTDVLYMLTRSRIFAAHALLDTQDRGTLDALDEAGRWAEQLAQTGDARGEFQKLKILGIKSNALADLGDFPRAYSVILDAIEQADTLAGAHPMNRNPARTSEVHRARAANMYLHAAKAGTVLGPPEVPMRLIEEAITLLAQREQRGWVNPAESGYRETYERIYDELAALLTEAKSVAPDE